MISFSPEIEAPTDELGSVEWMRRNDWPLANANGRTLCIADLFCGCGGLSLGAHEAARLSGRIPRICFAVDSNEDALNVYRSNFGLSDRIARNEDIFRFISNITSRKSFKKPDILLAGPPCQGHSDLNNSTRRKDPRNLLYLSVAEVARVLLPQVVLIENVPAIIHDKLGVMRRSMSMLEECGYFVSSRIVPIERFGVPQRRKRHILVASQKRCFDLENYSFPISDPPTAWDFISDLENEADARDGAFYKSACVSEENRKRIAYLFKNNLHDLPNRYRPLCHKNKEHSYISMYGRMRMGEPCQTITSGFGSMGQGRYVHPTRHRLITPHEAARLQGFPDFFSFDCVQTLTSLRRMIANAVPPQLSAHLVHSLISQGHF